MKKLFLTLLVIGPVLTACSSRPKFVPKKKVSRLGHIMTPSQFPRALKYDRMPASVENKKIPGLEEFISALKKHPEALDLPVGSEVLTEYTETEDGEKYSYKEWIVYLKQGKRGYYALKKDDLLMKTSLELLEADTPERVEHDIKINPGVREIKKVSDTRFHIIIASKDYPDEVCGMAVDLKKSVAFFEKACQMTDGSLTYRQKVLSTKTINLKSEDVIKELKAKKLVRYPDVDSCEIGSPTEDAHDCATVDEVEKDWSFLVR